ncbi:PAS domain-containing protein [Spirosoma sp. 209]|uniref:PAS domain-containing sensor histidine kinase n=1 Tax=Spirosoma sp. 209 TaxID=1955701 RepID=UPI00098D4D61|nr:PAS domain-containing protein [Spirosoma sp. 209]
MVPEQSDNASFPFLAGGGEMGQLTRHYDWSNTSLGHPDRWPLSLRTLVHMMLSSRFPMLIFWGPDLITFYNDAFRPSLGNDGKHPSSLGQRGEESWAESWPVIGPMIRGIMGGGDAVWFEDQKLPIYREGQMGYAYWTYSFSPLADDAGAVSGVLVTCTETTQAVESRQQLAVSEERFSRLIEQAPVAMALFSGPRFVISLANEQVLDYWGRTREEVINKPLFDALPEAAGQGFEELLTGVYTTGKRFVANELKVMLERNGQLEPTYIDFVYEPFYESDGVISGVLVISTEITDQVLTRRQVEANEQLLDAMIQRSPLGVAVFRGANNLIERANPALSQLWNHSAEEVTGWPLLEAAPQLAGQGFDRQLEAVRETGQPFIGREQPVRLVRNGQLKELFFDYVYEPLPNPDGSIDRVMVVANEVTEQRLARQQIEQSQQRLLASFEDAPVGIALISGKELIFQMANPFYGRLAGRPPHELVGKPLLTALPELAGQGFDELLRQVMSTGESYRNHEVPVVVRHGDRLETIYIDHTYHPQRDSTGQITHVLVVVVDMTQHVHTRRAVEASETRLRSVIASAPAAMGLFMGRDLVVELPNQAFIDIVGKGPDIVGKPLREVMPELLTENQPFLQILDTVYTSGQMFQSFGSQVKIVRNGVMTDNFYNITYTPLRDEQGRVFAILDIAIDVTEQIKAQQDLQQSEARYRQLSADLEQQVQARTQQLQALVGDLRRSNENLQQFAYVASHDLQEPLRKIQSFGDILKPQYADGLGEGVNFLERMQAAASRMSTLIKDLLSFSRISTQQEDQAQVSLTAVVQEVLLDLEMVIDETKAQVTIDPLPTVAGDTSQLGQLFSNLFSNALKFRRPDATPQIRIRCERVVAAALPPAIQPTRTADVYFCIEVADNGIGFDARYADRIFQVFQRLHSKGEFAGTGIGLAICQKVAANHGGTITATSQPGQGATFSLYLPA